MQYLIVAALVFGLCFAVDKVFTKQFRAKAQHKSGLSVRLPKRYASFGLILFVFGTAALFAGFTAGGGWLLPAGGALLMLTGLGLVLFYMTFGVFYNEEGFVLTSFGKRSTTYAYKDIQGQLLYNNQGHTLVELYLRDGRTLQLQSTMEGAYPFLDYAFAAWCRQTGREERACTFHDPANSCWFPIMEG